VLARGSWSARGVPRDGAKNRERMGRPAWVLSLGWSGDVQVEFFRNGNEGVPVDTPTQLAGASGPVISLIGRAAQSARPPDVLLQARPTHPRPPGRAPGRLILVPRGGGGGGGGGRGRIAEAYALLRFPAPPPGARAAGGGLPAPAAQPQDPGPPSRALAGLAKETSGARAAGLGAPQSPGRHQPGPPDVRLC